MSTYSLFKKLIIKDTAMTYMIKRMTTNEFTHGYTYYCISLL